MKPATEKIWCPKCHKRHKVPQNAVGATLRCRGCQFAFLIEDGLTTEPVSKPVEPSSAPIENVANPTAVSTSSNAALKRESTSNPKTAPSATRPPKAPTEVSAEASTEKPIPRLDNNYDDILDVLDSPSAEPVRAYAKDSSNSNPVAKAVSNPADANAATATKARGDVQAAVRAPVNKRKLQSHRQSRTFWMLIALLFSGLVAGFCWFGVSLLLKPQLSNWERKLVYSFGVPARFLPPLEPENEGLEPANSVKLRGEHADLAKRDDNFRDEFVVRQNARVAPDDEVGGAAEPNRQPADRRVAANQMAAGDGRLRMNSMVTPEGNQDPPAADAGRPPEPNQNPNPNANRPPPRQRMARQGMNNGGLPARNRNATRPSTRGDNRNKNEPDWKPPAITSADVQLISLRGMDPRVLASLQLDSQVGNLIAISADVLFTVDDQRRLNAVDWKTKTLLGSRQLDNEVVSIAKASAKRETQGVWLLSSNGRVEKWDVGEGSLQRGSSIPIGEIDTKNKTDFAISEYQIAVRSADTIVVADYLPTDQKIGSSISIPIPEYTNSNSQGVPEPIHAMKFSHDGEQLLAIIHDQIHRFNTRTGKLISKSQLPQNCVLPRDAKAGSCVISDDLLQVMVCKTGFIETCDVETGKPTGQYWANSPIPIRFASFGSGLLVGLSDNPKPIATIFQATPGQVSGNSDTSQKDKFAGDASRRNDSPKNEVDKKAELPAPSGDIPFLVSNSSTIAGPIQSLHFLGDHSLVMLSKKREVSIVDWKNGWQLNPLSINTGNPIDQIAVAPNDSLVAAVTSTNVKVWRVVDRASGQVELVSEFSGHSQPITRIAFSIDSAHVITGDKKGNVYAWSVADGKMTGGMEGFSRPIVSIMPKGDRGFVVMDNLSVGKGDVNHQRDRVIEFGRSVPAISQFSKNGNRIAFPTGNRLQIADRNSQRIVEEFDVSEVCRDLQFSHDHDLVLLLTRSGISVWDWSRGKRVGRIDSPASSAFNSFDLSNDDRYIAVVDGTQNAKILIFATPSKTKRDQ
jgi:WD40 repeat protein